MLSLTGYSVMTSDKPSKISGMQISHRLYSESLKNKKFSLCEVFHFSQKQLNSHQILPLYLTLSCFSLYHVTHSKLPLLKIQIFVIIKIYKETTSREKNSLDFADQVPLDKLEYSTDFTASTFPLRKMKKSGPCLYVHAVSKSINQYLKGRMEVTSSIKTKSLFRNFHFVYMSGMIM